jgi:hypothetical protein
MSAIVRQNRKDQLDSVSFRSGSWAVEPVPQEPQQRCDRSTPTCGPTPAAQINSHNVPATYSCAAANIVLLDHLVGAGQQRGWDGEAERLDRFHIDDQFELCRLLYREISRLGASEDLIDVYSSSTIHIV